MKKNIFYTVFVICIISVPTILEGNIKHTQISASKKQIHSLEKKIQKLQNKIDALKVQQDKLQTQVDTLKKDTDDKVEVQSVNDSCAKSYCERMMPNNPSCITMCKSGSISCISC